MFVSSTTALFIVTAVRASNLIPRLWCGARCRYRTLSVAARYRLGDPERWVQGTQCSGSVQAGRSREVGTGHSV